MKRYLIVCFKRTAKFLPFVLAVALIIFMGLTVVLNAFYDYQNSSDEQKIFKIGVVGEDETGYLQLGMTAIENFDAVRFAVQLCEFEGSKTATDSLKKGDISAYIVIPDDFVQKAKRGEILSIKYVTTPGSVGIITMFKDELTATISDMVESAQRGVYGIENALDSNGHSDLSYKQMNRLNVEYIKFIFDRDKMYSVETLGIGDGLTFSMYMFCGLSVVFLMLTALVYAPLFIKSDYSLNRLMYAKRHYAFGQVLSEFTAFFVSVTAVCIAVFSVLSVFNEFTGVFEKMGINESFGIISFAVKMLPVILVITALSFMLFEMNSGIVSGVLLHFFTAITLCYVSGCIYPIYTFPDSIQSLSKILPTGVSRAYLAEAASGKMNLVKIMALIMFSVLFLGISVLVRRNKITARRA